MAKVTKIGRMMNCYLIEGEQGAVLVDTQGESQREFLAKWLGDKNVGLIVLTHGHIDHVANAAYLSEKLDAPIAMHRADLPLLQNNGARKLHASTFLGFVVKFFSWFAMKAKIDPFVPEVFLKEGDTLEDYGINAVVKELPGHTAGSIGLLVDGDQLLAGDAVASYIVPTVAVVFEDEKKMLESADWIGQTSGAKDIYPGHGKVIERY